MPAIIAATQAGDLSFTGGASSVSVTRNVGEGLLLWVMYGYQWGGASPMQSAIWDPGGDNQPMTLLYDFAGAPERRVALFHLKNPTSAKTANISITSSGGSVDGGYWRVDRISGFDPALWITNSSHRTEPTPQTNGLPITVTSGAGQLAIAGGYVRFEAPYIGGGSAQNYVSSGAGAITLFRATKPGTASVSFDFTYGYAYGYDNYLYAVSIADAAPVLPDVSGSATLTDAVAGGSFGINSSGMAGTVSLDETVAAGSLSIAGISIIDASIALDPAVASGSFGSIIGSVVSGVFKSTVTRLPLLSTAIGRVAFLLVSDGTLAANLQGPNTTGSDGRLSITSTGLTPGVDYLMIAWNTDGSQAGVQKVTAA